MDFNVTTKKQISQIGFVAAILIAYLFSNIAGCVLMSVYAIFNFIKYSDKGVIVFLRLLIVAMPLSFVGVMGTSMHQTFSWYNIFLVVYMVYIICSKNRFSTLALLGIGVVFLILTFGLIWSDDMGADVVEILQVMMMLIPMVASFQYNNVNRHKLTDVFDLLILYSNVCVASALANLVQYFAYNRIGLSLGLIEQTGLTRTHFNLFFKGFSVLPIFLGIGFIMLFTKSMWSKMKLLDVLNMVIIFFAMIINSSRTGLFCVCIVGGLIFIKSFSKKIKMKYLLIAIICIPIAIWGIDFIMAQRTDASFLDDNGRLETYVEGVRVWLQSIRTFFIGGGFGEGGFWESKEEPHNLIIQTLAQCGIIVTIIILLFFCSYFKANKGNKFIFVPLYIFLSGMLITDFYANAFSCIAFIVVDMFRTAYHENEVSTREKFIIGAST